MTESLLGSAGVERLKKFMEYDAGWNFGGGFPLSRESLSKMEYFINQFFNFQVTPSVFMSNEGNLLLGWEDKTGKGIELEFFNDKIGYLIESIDEEDEITLDRKQIEILVNKLHQV